MKADNAAIFYETDVFGTAYSRVPPEYEGPCQMAYPQGEDKRYVVFPSVAEAEAAAMFAVGHLGGYSAAELSAAPNATPTHQEWTDWAFD